MSLILSKKIYDIKQIPKKTGIYFFIDSNNIPIYIGKSLDINKRINQHLRDKSKKSEKIRSKYNHIRYLETKSEMLALLIESQEIKRNKPILNRKLRKKRTNAHVNFYTDSSGYYGLKISKKNKDTITSFQSTRKAKSFISYISEKFNLCKKINSINKENYCCYAISSNENSTICCEKESLKSYNQRFIEMKNSITLPKKKFLIIDKNYKKPYPFVSVDNGTIEGYGFLKNSCSEYSANLKRLDFITKDEIIIIKNFYKKNFNNLHLSYIE